VHTIFGNGYGSGDGDCGVCNFGFPCGLAFSLDESCIYVADTNNHSIRCLDLQKLSSTTILGFERKRGVMIGELDQTLMTEPRGITMNTNGNLLVTTYSMIYNLDLNTNKASIITGKPIIGFKDGYLNEALFDHPDGIVYVDNTIFVADSYNHRIRAIDIGTNIVSTFAVYFIIT